MFHYKSLVFAIFLTTMASVESEESLVPPKFPYTNVFHILEEMQAGWSQHPEMADWLIRAGQRLVMQPNASIDDVKKLWRMGIDASRVIHDFVTGPDFNTTTDEQIESIVERVSPFVALMPLREVRELRQIIMDNPDIIQIIAKHEKKAFKEFATTTEIFIFFKMLAYTLIIPA